MSGAPPMPPRTVADLAASFGTPLYVYDLAAVRRAYHDLADALPAGARLHYSLKANPHPRLVAELARLGCWAEVSSVGELDMAVAEGMKPAQVQLTGPGKTDAAIARALSLGVTRFSVESPHDLARVGSLASRHRSRADCLLRVNADGPVAGMGLAMSGRASQFGADSSWILRSPEEFAGSGGASVTGLHFYAGTNLADEGVLMRQFEDSIRLAARLLPLLPGATELNLGGGFGAPYAQTGERQCFTGLANGLTRLLDTYLPGWRHGSPAVGFESGRYLVADSGTLVCRIIDVKVSKGVTFVVIDAGVNQLGGMSGLRRLMPLQPVLLPLPPGPAADWEASARADKQSVSCCVVGPLCTPLDTLARGVPLADPRPGGLLAIRNVGAYGLTASLIAFLSHPLPAEVITDGLDVVDASRIHLCRSAVPGSRSPGSHAGDTNQGPPSMTSRAPS